MKEIHKRTTILHNRQDGLVAIFSVLMIMGILTLLTIGFTNITRQAQRRSLDDALKTQAYYAAEAGVNGIISNLSSISSQNTDCSTHDGLVPFDIDTGRGIAISCLLVNPTPTNLEFGNVPEMGEGEPIIAEITSASGVAIDELQFEWDSQNPSDAIFNHTPLSTPPGGSPRLLAETAWGTNVGMVRVDLVPAAIDESDRAGLVNGSYTFYLYPTMSGSPGAAIGVGPGPDNQAGTLSTQCTSTSGYRCMGYITPWTTYSSYYIRMYSYYNPVKVKITPFSGGTAVALRNGQATIDATGKANDIYRRIQVRAPISSTTSGLHDPFAVFSGESICKRYIGVPGNTRVEAPAAAGADPSCNIQ